MADKLDILKNKISSNDYVSHVDLSNCGLRQFPFTDLLPLQHSLVYLNLGGNYIEYLDEEEIIIFQKLKILFFGSNLFKKYPRCLCKLPDLYMVSFKSNELTEIEGDCFSNPRLTWLILTDNKLTKIPSSIGNLMYLRKLMLSGNMIEELPTELNCCKELELVRIAANRLAYIPPWFFSLPKLSWIAFAGNLLPQLPSPTAAIQSIEFGNISIDYSSKLGEGTSGIVYKCTWNNQEYAIKLFKTSTTTSDGLPEDEMKACIAAGKHPNLVSVVGNVINHPNNTPALLFDVIPSDYSIFGQPPSFDTCTRDVYAVGRQVTVLTGFAILKDISSALEHLHSRGINHGDVYGHNIMVSNSTSNCLLCDFGSATFYDNSINKEVEKNEVRAYGCLVDDVLSILSDGESDLPGASKLGKLRDMCMSEIDQRPTFQEIVQYLRECEYK